MREIRRYRVTGTRMTFDGRSRETFEVHINAFNGQAAFRKVRKRYDKVDDLLAYRED